MFYYTVMIMVLGFIWRMLALLSIKWQNAKAQLLALPQKLLIADKYSSLTNAYSHVEKMHALYNTLDKTQNFYQGELVTLQLQPLPVDSHTPNPDEALLHDALYQYVFWYRVQDHAAIMKKNGFDDLPPLLIKMVQLQHIAVNLFRKKDVNLLKAWLLTLDITEKMLINWHFADLSNLDLQNFDFSYGIYLNTNFNKSLLKGASFEKSYFNALILGGTVLVNINWEKTKFNVGYDYHLQGSTMDESTFNVFRIQGLNCFSAVTFVGDFNESDFSERILSQCRFKAGMVIKPNFSGAIMPCISFESAPISPIFSDVKVSLEGMMRKIENKLLQCLDSKRATYGLYATMAMQEYHHLLAIFHEEGLDPEQLTREHWSSRIQALQLSSLKWLLSSDVKRLFDKVKFNLPFFGSKGDSSNVELKPNSGPLSSKSLLSSKPAPVIQSVAKDLPGAAQVLMQGGPSLRSG